MSGKMNRLSSYAYGEGRTGLGQLVEFTCPLELREQVKEFLEKNVRTIDIPTTGRVNISHGGYGRYTRYDVTQHEYAGGGPEESGGWCYIEVLEVKNPPDERWGIVVHESASHGGASFTEWETLKDARVAFKRHWGKDTREFFPKLEGFKRRVVCGSLTPWFYAIGNEHLLGDYAFPEGLQDDPVYRFGRQFVVFDEEGIPSVKTCMGTRFFKRKRDYYPYEEKQYRIVYWNDGTVWDESGEQSWWVVKYGSPRPLEEGELWITEAVEQFHKLIAGSSDKFEVNFTDGNKFVGRVIKAESKSPCAEGHYYLVVHLKGVKDPLQGWVRDFKPTPKAQNVVQFVTQCYAKQGKEVERVEIKQSKTKQGGKKWAGVFFHPSR